MARHALRLARLLLLAALALPALTYSHQTGPAVASAASPISPFMGWDFIWKGEQLRCSPFQIRDSAEGCALHTSPSRDKPTLARLLSPLSAPRTAPPIPQPDHAIFTRVAARSGVPVALLLALSYVQTGWAPIAGQSSGDGGYGLMDLAQQRGHDTLNAAARLVGASPALLMRDEASNVLGGALLLARIARDLSPRHALPATLASWGPAVVRFTGMQSQLAASLLLREVNAALAHAASPPRAPAAALSLTQSTQPDAKATSALRITLAHPLDGGETADYPGAVWAPSPNYSAADRPSDLDVPYLVVHDTESSCASALNWLIDKSSRASAHFLVCQDGTVYQLVHIHDVAWHAGNWYINQHSIGIEHEGFRDSDSYTRAEYDASAAIVRWLDQTYGLAIAPDRTSIFGHENVPHATHTDPGPWWDWDYYLSAIRGGSAYDGGDANVAMVAVGQAILRGCARSSCPAVGTANWGEQFALVATSSGWDEVYYNGTTAWVDATSVTAGAGTRLVVTVPTLNVRDEPSAHGTIVGAVSGGQIYVSRFLDTALDADGWWLIAYNHRYGFVCGRYIEAIPEPGLSVPTSTRTSTPAATPTIPYPTASPVPSASVSPTSLPGWPETTPTAVVTATAMTTVTTTAVATVTATVTVTATGSPSITETLPPGPFDPTGTVGPPAYVTPTATATPTGTATPTPSPTATATPRPTATATPAKPRPRTLSVKPVHPHVLLGTPFRLRVHTDVRGATLRYQLTLPGGKILRATGRSDRHGNALRTIMLPGNRWRDAVMRLLRRRHAHIPVPHSLAARYSVRVMWHSRTLTRGGTFRVVFWKPV